MTGPAATRRRLGAYLRRMREARSLRLEDVAARLDLAPSTISRIETGHAPTRTSYLAVMLDLYHITDAHQRRMLADLAREGQRKRWHAEYRDLLPAGTDHYLDLETAASQICGYSPQAIPDLLQTQDYAAAACHATRPDLTPEQARQLATLQIQRQQHGQNDKRELHLIIDESALLRMIGTPSVMARQLRHLLAFTVDQLVTLQHGRLPGTPSEKAVLAIAASIAGDTIPVCLGAHLGSLDSRNIALVTDAITAANG